MKRVALEPTFDNLLYALNSDNVNKQIVSDCVKIFSQK